MTYEVFLSKKAEKDLKELERQGYGKKVSDILSLLETDPLCRTKGYEKLMGDLTGKHSRRINATDRVVYTVIPSDDLNFEGVVRVSRMRTHYIGIHSIFM
jgi:Txe/YoeB family toxin of toxin-antitoxin system